MPEYVINFFEFEHDIELSCHRRVSSVILKEYFRDFLRPQYHRGIVYEDSRGPDQAFEESMKDGGV